MKKIRILANDGIDDAGRKMLEDEGFEVDIQHFTADELPEKLREYDAITVRSATQVRNVLIDACSNLKVIGRGGVGLDNIDVVYAKEKGVAVYNTPAASSRSVAELVIAHALSLSRHLHMSNRTMPVSGQADFAKLKKQYSEGREVLGKTMGIIGFGRIGQEVAKMALGLGMHVIAADPYVTEATIHIRIPGAPDEVQVRIETIDLLTLLRTSDMISIHIPKSDAPIIGTQELTVLKPGVILINTARGGVFDEDALLAGLNNGIIGGVGLDVFVGEPTPRADILTHQRVSMSPHIGGSTAEAQENVGKELAGLIIRHFKT